MLSELFEIFIDYIYNGFGDRVKILWKNMENFSRRNVWLEVESQNFTFHYKMLFFHKNITNFAKIFFSFYKMGFKKRTLHRPLLLWKCIFWIFFYLHENWRFFCWYNFAMRHYKFSLSTWFFITVYICINFQEWKTICINFHLDE